ncbi:MAG TPA: DNA polymerase III subunit alpha [Alphaproteobacteria bacterium]|nr:DNA polymerase III subunit alpha [Alphaproteobacteria bacterium]HAJ46584.1 DNA polymerase III subunit alpha [Alphaproteobacteria bacterium]
MGQHSAREETVPFVHLRVHSAYSLLEGAIRVEDLPGLCRKHGMPAVAVTDTNNLFGLYEISEALASQGIQPITACQLACHLVQEGPQAALKQTKGPMTFSPLAFYVQTAEGYANLLKLASLSYLGVGPGEPAHISWEALEQHAEGLIVLTGGPKGAVSTLAAQGQIDAARDLLLRLKRLFPNRLYVELQRHGLPQEIAAEPHLLDLAYQLDLPIVATNEPFFAEAGGYHAHDVLLCIADGAYVLQEDRRRETPEHFFKSTGQMQALFADLPEALASTIEIAKRCAFKPEKRAAILPLYAPASGLAPEDELRQQARAGLKARLAAEGRFAEPEAYQKRLEFELDVIVRMNFAGYFLIVSDFMKWTRARGIPVGVRGSGAGSIVAWALEITALDPLRFGLVFERFLNPERVSMPDFDIDFCQERRAEVIRYVQDKYGHDRVAQIITFGTLQAKAAIRDVGRALQLPHGLVDRVAKMIKVAPGQSIKLKDAIAAEPRMAQAAAEDDQVKRLFEVAEELEGLYRHASTHAAGVVIGDRPLDEIVPLYRDPNADMPVTQLDYEQAEKAGLVKFDFLGLKTLSVIASTEKLVAEAHAQTIKTDRVPFDDPKAYHILGRGDSTGVFQLESPGMRDLLRKMKPDRIEDLIALVALYRPGPMDNIPKYIDCKHGRDRPTYLHPALEPILRDTHGVMTYQEDVMLIARELAGYSLGQADELRRAMGKKIKEKMAEQRVKFTAGAGERGIPPAIAEQIFDQAEKFAGYGFNKAHAAAYAQVAYQTAWLKANFPVEFLCASMTLDIGAPDRLNIFRQEASRFGVEVLPPDINRSHAVFASATGEAGKSVILYALAAIRNVGRQAMDEVVAERARHGPFKTIFDFARRMDPKALNKRALENLIQAGAFDNLVKHRAQAMAAIDTVLGESNAAARGRTSQQETLFGGESQAEPSLPQVPPWHLTEKLSREFDAIGFYLSGHPLQEFEAALRRLRVEPVAQLLAASQRGPRSVTLAGAVIARKDRRTRDGNSMAHIGFSDASGMFEAVAFSEALAQCGEHLTVGKSVVLTASVRWEGDDLKLQIASARPLSEAAADTGAGMRVQISHADGLNSLAERLKGHKGKGLVTLVMAVEGGAREVEVELPGRYAVTPMLCRAVKDVPAVMEVEEL